MIDKKVLYASLFVLLAITLDASAQQLVKSVDLITDAFSYDNKQVIFRGEVIGVMKRGEFAWVNVYDGEYAIGLLAPISQIKDIQITGDYGHKGDMIEATGVFYRADEENGGDLCIHTDSIRVLRRGYKVEHPVNKAKIIFIVFLSLVVILLARIYPNRRVM